MSQFVLVFETAGCRVFFDLFTGDKEIETISADGAVRRYDIGDACHHDAMLDLARYPLAMDTLNLTAREIEQRLDAQNEMHAVHKQIASLLA